LLGSATKAYIAEGWKATDTALLPGTTKLLGVVRPYLLDVVPT